ncbi:MAG: AMP-binding protein [Acidimicrobiia bacterium]|nr:AMP-binding protein [Acidimicrobiia bacterium]
MRVPLTVADFLDRAGLVYPKQPGFIDEPDPPGGGLGELTYGRVAELARAQAAGFDAAGLERGDRVGIVSQNAARLLVSFFGVSSWGRVLVPINFRLGRDEIAYIVEHSGLRTLLVDPELDEVTKGIDVENRIVLGTATDGEIFPEGGQPEPWDDPDEDATATINYTSGTTARPKGVQMTHRTIWLNAVTFGLHTQISDRDVYLHTLPMFHCNGWGMPYGLTGVGTTQIVLRKVDGTEILRRVDQHGVTLMCGAPAVVNSVLDAARSWDGPIPGAGTTRIVVAGAAPPTSTIEQVETVLGWEFIQIYGLTETAPLLTINRTRREWDDLPPDERARHLSRAGVPAIGIRTETDDSGEILARGNHILEGYWEQPEASEAALEGGWFHTGDGGSIDGDGYVTISDRKKDVIISGGENVSSIEVEDCLFSHPAVAEVAVIGIPSDKWGEEVTALVVLADGEDASPDELISWCKERIAGYKTPKTVEFRDELARTATGKLQKYKLRYPYWEGTGSQIN